MIFTPTVLGIDGGGTRTRGYVANLEGRILAEAESGPLNWHSTGWTLARAELARLIKRLHRVRAARGPHQHVAIGSAALNQTASDADIQKLCKGILPARSISLRSDGETAWFGAGLGTPGVLVVSGTGSIVFAGNQLSQLHRVGGWGPLLGDEGSACWMAVQIIRRCLGSDEQTRRPTAPGLDRLVLDHYQSRSWNEVFEVVYACHHSKDHLAALSEVIATQLPQDRDWKEVCTLAGRSLASQALAASAAATFTRKEVPCWIQGSVLQKNKRVLNTFKSALRGTALRVRKPALNPSLGPLALALQKAGASTSISIPTSNSH